MAAASPALQLAQPVSVPRVGLPYRWVVLICMMPAMTVFLIDTTVVNVALAKFGAVFSVDVATVQWAVTGYALASGISTPMAGFMEERFSVKRIWLIALTTFVASSALCGLAPAFWVLIVGRVLQGAAGGIIMPLVISTLFRAFPPGQRGAAFGLFAIPMVAGPALGPTIGGYIVTNWDWRLVFFVNLPIGALAILLGALLMEPDTSNPLKRLDLGGAILSTLSFGSILYGISRISDDGWGSFSVQGLVGFGLVSLVVFTIYEVRQEEPLLDMRLYLVPLFTISNIISWVSTVALFGAEFMLPLYLQNLRGLSAVDTGLMLMPQGLAVALFGPIAGRLMDRIGPRWIVLVGFSLLAFNTYQMSQLTLTTDYGTLRWLLVIRGVALGFSFQPTTITAMAAVPDRLRTNASSLSTASRNVFQSFGIALLSTVIQTQTQFHQQVLSWQVQPNTPSAGLLATLAAAIQRTGVSQVAAQAEATALMLGQIAQQATVLGFADAYRLTFVSALLALALAWLLPAEAETGAGNGGMAMGH